jgi:hypothetical protein
VSRGASSAVPLQSPETGSSCGRHVAVTIASSRAVHVSFRVLPKSGIAISVWRSPHDLCPSRGRPSGCSRVLRSAATVRLSPNPLMDLALLQSVTRVGPSAVTRRAERYVVDEHHSPGVSAPSAHEVAGSDLRRVCLTRLRGAFRLSQPLDASFPPVPCRSCFIPAALMGFALQRVSLPNRRRHLVGASCPSRRCRRRPRKAVVRARSESTPPRVIHRRSEERRRCHARERSRHRARLQGFEPVSEVRTPVGGC